MKIGDRVRVTYTSMMFHRGMLGVIEKTYDNASRPVNKMVWVRFDAGYAFFVWKVGLEVIEDERTN